MVIVTSSKCVCKTLVKCLVKTIHEVVQDDTGGNKVNRAYGCDQFGGRWSDSVLFLMFVSLNFYSFLYPIVVVL